MAMGRRGYASREKGMPTQSRGRGPGGATNYNSP